MSGKKNVPPPPSSQQIPGQGTSTPTTTTAGTSTATTVTPSTSGTKRKLPSETSASQRTKPLADVLGQQSRFYAPLPKDLEGQTVRDISSDFSNLIPPDAPARQQDLDALAAKGIKFDLAGLAKLAQGAFGTIFQCEFDGETTSGEKISKSLACKRVAITEPASRLDQPIISVENQIRNEMLTCDILIQNEHNNVVQHDLVWRIKAGAADKVSYQNPITHLIFMELCSGSLKEFCIQNYGYSTARSFKSVPEEVNKIWMYHVARGLDFLHDKDKRDKRTGKAWISIIHHDMKHDNILYQMCEGRIKFLIADFGLSEIKQFRSRVARTQQVMSSSDCGSKRFMSPESQELRKQRKKGVQPMTIKDYEGRKKDVFALGVMLSDCLVGFTDATVTGNEYSLANDWIKRVRSSQKNLLVLKFQKVSRPCLDLLFKMCDPNSRNRPLAAEILKDQWFRDQTHLRNNFVDLTGSGQQPGKKTRK